MAKLIVNIEDGTITDYEGSYIVEMTNVHELTEDDIISYAIAHGTQVSDEWR